jgi:hypothetical protein
MRSDVTHTLATPVTSPNSKHFIISTSNRSPLHFFFQNIQTKGTSSLWEQTLRNNRLCWKCKG